jgi:hypothetical protein
MFIHVTLDPDSDLSPDAVSKRLRQESGTVMVCGVHYDPKEHINRGIFMSALAFGAAIGSQFNVYYLDQPCDEMTKVIRILKRTPRIGDHLHTTNTKELFG